MDQKGPERGGGEAKTGKGQSRNIRHLWPFTGKRTLTTFRFQTEFCFQTVWKPFKKNLHPFERLIHPFGRNVQPFEQLGHPFDKNIHPFERLGRVRLRSILNKFGIMQVSVRLAALPIPEYLDFHSGYSE